MPFTAHDHAELQIPAGSLDDDPGARLSYHLFCGSKAPWFEIADGLPQHETWPDAAR